MAWKLLVVLLSLYLLFMSRERTWGDAHVMLRQAQALVERQSLELEGMDHSPQIFFLDRDGKRYGLYPLGNSLALVPSYLVFKLAERVRGAPLGLLYHHTAKLTPALAAAAACALFFALLRRRGTRPRLAAGLALALGTMTLFAVYARVAYSEPLQAALFLWIVLLCLRLDEDPGLWPAAQLGFAAGWLINVKVVNVIALAVVALWLLWRLAGRPRRLLLVGGAALAAFLPWIALMLWVNHVKTGSAFDTGYATAGHVEAIFSGRFYDALFGLFLSPGKGLFFFSPIVLLGVLGLRGHLRERRPEALLQLGVILAVIGPHLFFHSWYGGLVWGPRYLIPVTPLIFLPAASWLEGALARGRVRWRRAALGGLAAVSLAVQIIGCSYWWGQYQMIVKLTRGEATEDMAYTSTVFNPAMSPIIGQAWMLEHHLTGDPHLERDCPYRHLIDPVPDMQGFAAIPIDLWLTAWYEAGGPARRWMITISIVLGLALVASSLALVRDLRRAGR